MLTQAPLTIERVSRVMERKRVVPHKPLSHRWDALRERARPSGMTVRR
jgi:hypothetical protein